VHECRARPRREKERSDAPNGIRARPEMRLKRRIAHRREYSPRRAREIAESALCFHEHPVLPQTSRTRAETGLGALSKSSTRDLRSVKRRPSAAVQLPCNIVLPPCTLPTNWPSSLGLVYFQQRHWNRFSRRRHGYAGSKRIRPINFRAWPEEESSKVPRRKKPPASAGAPTCRLYLRESSRSVRTNEGDATRVHYACIT